ncbi:MULTISPECIES: cytochrome c [unclassified Bosea (in: a-proteobacteria)]|uniref:c-type cytochrome n=1 Tax=unclassified Bosea (in: a-proteobacteria) TaxID=2653178 RepID=UPI00095708B9|nr:MULTISPECIES: cytochrome c [unclassified Bosea (in: a-proteobacteria)]TAJ33583.1 MAG: cytochrome c [Bosea sp. (in: a-proteobacteria)]SIQ23685.1 Cytochrome c556 [Bosea sp. TND4EK4]
MIRTVLVVAGLGLGLTAVMAQSNPIAERQQIMKAVGGATREGAAMAKGDVAFDAAKAQTVFKTYADAAAKMPALFPDSSKTGGETTAAPKIWEDQAGFKAAFVKFGQDAEAGAKAADLASFRTAFGAATKNCGTCHEVYRIKK